MLPFIEIEFMSPIEETKSVLNKDKTGYIDKNYPTDRYVIEKFYFDFTILFIASFHTIKIVIEDDKGVRKTHRKTLVLLSDGQKIISPYKVEEFSEKVITKYNQANYDLHNNLQQQE